MRRRFAWRRLWAALGICIAAPCLSAADPPVSLTTTPASLDLCPAGGTGRVWVVVRNTGSQPVRNVCLSALTNGPVTWNFPDASSAHTTTCEVMLPQLAAGASVVLAMAMKLERAPITGAGSPVHLQAEYVGGEPSKEPVGGSAIATVDIRPVQPPAADALKADVRVEAASMHEEESARALLTLTNNSPSSLALSPLVFKSPTNTSLRLKPQTSMPDTLAPASTTNIELELVADKSILPGKRVGSIEIEAQNPCGAVFRRTAAFEVSLGVFGQSELLTALGVPALLFVPGFLIVTLWAVLWRVKNIKVSFLGKSNADEFLLSPKSLEFWLLAISLSLGAYWLAPTISRVGYRDAYQLRDIARLWGLSLGVGFFTYLLMLLLDQWYQGRRTLRPTDDVDVALKKMLVRGWQREQCKPVKWKSSTAKGFRLWTEKEGASWIIPPIQWTRTPDEAMNFDLGGAGTIERLLQEVRKIKSAKAGTIKWLAVDGFNSPRVVADADLVDDTGDLVVATESP